MKKWIGILLFLTVYALYVFLFVPVFADADYKTIFYIEDGVLTPYFTSAKTAADFLYQQGIVLMPCDTLNMQYTDNLESGSRLEIKRGFYVNVSVDGKSEKVKIRQDTTVGRFIQLFESERNMKFYYTGSLLPILDPGDTIFLRPYREEIIKEEIEIPFETYTEETDSLVKGTENILQEGLPGKLINTYRVMYLNNEEHSRELISEEIDHEPQAGIILVGIAQPTPTPTPRPTSTPVPSQAQRSAAPVSSASAGVLGTKASSTNEFSYSKVYTMVATAYTAGPESTGKSPGMPGYGITSSGMRVRPGVVAVDPRVIPLGTRLYVEGYGYSIAADTGGAAIRGYQIDLYMEKLADAYRWGRRTVKVYVLN